MPPGILLTTTTPSGLRTGLITQQERRRRGRHLPALRLAPGVILPGTVAALSLDLGLPRQSLGFIVELAVRVRRSSSLHRTCQRRFLRMIQAMCAGLATSTPAHLLAFSLLDEYILGRIVEVGGLPLPL
jgi:hypothetical protein